MPCVCLYFKIFNAIVLFNLVIVKYVIKIFLLLIELITHTDYIQITQSKMQLKSFVNRK